jgi:uncharacterized RDD family membrane protein YckC
MPFTAMEGGNITLFQASVREFSFAIMIEIMIEFVAVIRTFLNFMV